MHNLTIQEPMAARKLWLMAKKWRADAEGSQFQERWEAEYFSVECKEMPVCFIYHQPLQTGTHALSHRSKQSERESGASSKP